ncbi:hypothetical protein CJF31_00010791 [Rutstroemia sp. NJR-2017a BVV2]|nr:hypothetical protein CJF31_00010791 [Rutstroemia sp. NJR-2017a BVV2]
MKIKYSYLKLYLYLLRYISNNKYIYRTKETLKYLLLSYSFFNLIWIKLKNKLAINYLLFLFLLNINSGIEASITYLNKINIYTQKYYLARKLEDN